MAEVRAGGGRLPTEKITLDLDPTGLYAARFAAAAENMPLDDWISRAVRARAIQEDMERQRERGQLDLDDPPGWAEMVERNVLGVDEA
ncbi:hypothetical protein GCM10025331_16460 [Actinoplanes utahensis]|nr:hypothetical protein Aut01nite_23660 [Actinoplanes utahensis]